jgi:hypothetical protein
LISLPPNNVRTLIEETVETNERRQEGGKEGGREGGLMYIE